MIITAVTEAGKVGGQLAKDFFKEEYILNNKIGKYSLNGFNSGKSPYYFYYVRKL